MFSLFDSLFFHFQILLSLKYLLICLHQETGGEAASIVEEKGLKQVSDSGAIEVLIDAVIKVNEDKVAEYRAGKDKLFGFFVGQVMKQSGGQANPEMVNQILRTRLDGRG